MTVLIFSEFCFHQKIVTGKASWPWSEVIPRLYKPTDWQNVRSHKISIVDARMLSIYCTKYLPNTAMWLASIYWILLYDWLTPLPLVNQKSRHNLLRVITRRVRSWDWALRTLQRWTGRRVSGDFMKEYCPVIGCLRSGDLYSLYCFGIGWSQSHTASLFYLDQLHKGQPLT